jgi:hypothetical protein
MRIRKAFQGTIPPNKILSCETDRAVTVFKTRALPKI